MSYDCLYCFPQTTFPSAQQTQRNYSSMSEQQHSYQNVYQISYPGTHRYESLQDLNKAHPGALPNAAECDILINR